MADFKYSAAAELFPTLTRSRIANRQPVTSRRFDTAAEAIRYAMEELEPALLEGTYLEVDDNLYDGVGIRNLYANAIYPLPKPVPYSPPVKDDQIAASRPLVEGRGS